MKINSINKLLSNLLAIAKGYEIPKWPLDDDSEKLIDLSTVLGDRLRKTGPSPNLGHDQIRQEISLFLEIHNAH